jgi:thioredoxin reductase
MSESAKIAIIRDRFIAPSIFEAPIRNVFLFVGADPATEWLKGCGVALDKAGFVTTGAPCADGGPHSSPLESSISGVFAVGDVRSGQSSGSAGRSAKSSRDP